MTALTQNNCSNMRTFSTKVAVKPQQTVLSTLLVWYDRYKSRQQLAAMEPEMLKDIGITAEAARLEAKKPFWR